MADQELESRYRDVYARRAAALSRLKALRQELVAAEEAWHGLDAEALVAGHALLESIHQQEVPA